MQVQLSERVKTFLITLGRDDRERVQIWSDYLRNWEDDAYVRSQSVALSVQGQLLYMLRTSTEFRIFYSVDPQSKVIDVVDIATRDTILAFGPVAAVGP